MCARKRTAQLVREITALPALPTVVKRLLGVLGDPHYTADQVTDVIRTDPALTARVLKLANSPAYGFSRGIESVSRAVVVLGSRSLRSLVTSAGVADAMDRMTGGADLETLWRHAAYTATGARVIALHTGHPCPEEAFLAGLIHDIGELALAVVRPREYAELRRHPAAEGAELERRLLGMTHTRAGQQLLGSWNLPDDLSEVAGLHHDLEATTAPERRTLAVVALADMLSRVRGLGHEAPPAERHARALVDLVKLPRGLDADLLREIDIRYLETSRFLHPDRVRVQDPFAANEPRHVALVCADTRRSLWLHELLAYHGDVVVPFGDYFENPESADLVLLDPHCLDAHALRRLAPALSRTPERLVLYADPELSGLASDLPADLPVLPILFSASELGALPAGVGERTLSPR